MRPSPIPALFRTPIYIHSHKETFENGVNFMSSSFDKKTIERADLLYKKAVAAVSNSAKHLHNADGPLRVPYTELVLNYRTSSEYRQMIDELFKLKKQCSNIKNNPQVSHLSPALQKEYNDLNNFITAILSNNIANIASNAVNNAAGNFIISLFQSDKRRNSSNMPTTMKAAQDYLTKKTKNGRELKDTVQKFLSKYIEENLLQTEKEINTALNNMIEFVDEYANDLIRCRHGITSENQAEVAIRINKIKTYKNKKENFHKYCGLIYEQLDKIMLMICISNMRGSLRVNGVPIGDIQVIDNTAKKFDDLTTDTTVVIDGKLLGRSLKFTSQEGVFSKQGSHTAIARANPESKGPDSLKESDSILYQPLQKLLNVDDHLLEKVGYFLFNKKALSIASFQEQANAGNVVKQNPVSSDWYVDNSAYTVKSSNASDLFNIPLFLKIRESILLVGFLQAFLGPAFSRVNIYKSIEKGQKIELEKDQGLPLVIQFGRTEYWTADVLDRLLDIISAGLPAIQKFMGVTELMSSNTSELNKLFENFTVDNLTKLFVLKKLIEYKSSNRYEDFVSGVGAASVYDQLLTDYKINSQSVLEFLKQFSNKGTAEIFKKVLFKPFHYRVAVYQYANPIINI